MPSEGASLGQVLLMKDDAVQVHGSERRARHRRGVRARCPVRSALDAAAESSNLGGGRVVCLDANRGLRASASRRARRWVEQHARHRRPRSCWLVPLGGGVGLPRRRQRATGLRSRSYSRGLDVGWSSARGADTHGAVAWLAMGAVGSFRGESAASRLPICQRRGPKTPFRPPPTEDPCVAR